MSVIMAKPILGRCMEDPSDEVKKAWRIILAELDPSLKKIKIG